MRRAGAAGDPDVQRQRLERRPGTGGALAGVAARALLACGGVGRRGQGAAGGRARGGSGRQRHDGVSAGPGVAWARCAGRRDAAARGPSHRQTCVRQRHLTPLRAQVRNISEQLVDKLNDHGAAATLIRVNPELPLADNAAGPRWAGVEHPRAIPLLSRGLDAIKAIDAALESC
eukprot:6456208-Prymnesium_polylepis.1